MEILQEFEELHVDDEISFKTRCHTRISASITTPIRSDDLTLKIIPTTEDSHDNFDSNASTPKISSNGYNNDFDNKENECIKINMFSDIDTASDISDLAVVAKAAPSSTVKSRRMSLDLCMAKDEYNELLYLPKYSEAEFQTSVDNILSHKLKDIEAQHALSIICLKSEVHEKEKELQRMQKLLDESKSDLALQKAQTKALSHSLQVIESEFALYKKSSEISLVSETKSVIDRMTAEAEASRIADTTIFSLKISKLEDCIAKLETRYDADISAYKNKLETAVAEAKQHVYAKAQVKMEQGNKEFQKVRAQLKELSSELALSKATNNNLLQELDSSKVSVETHRIQYEDTILKNKKLNDIIVDLLMLIMYSDGDCKDINLNKDSNIPIDRLSSYTNQAIGIMQEKESLSCQLKQRVEDVQLDMDRLRAAKNSIEMQLDEEKCKIVVQNDDVKRMNLKLLAMKDELNEAQSDRDAQYSVTAKLATSSAATEEKLDKLQQEMQETTDRCNQLRKMNEELLEMLEKMHSK